MHSEILTTKLYIPSPGLGLIPRPRLLDWLNQGLDKKLSLISAPAGFGKTTLLSQWIAQSEIPFCWFALDDNDNDLGRFLAYFIASLQSIQIEVDLQTLKLLQSPQQNTNDTVLIPLINQIAVAPSRFALVLDDYHKINNSAIHDAVTYILDHQPLGMHLVIATRSDPPVPLARLRARGEMVETRAVELRFTFDEGFDFLNQTYPSRLGPKNIRALVTRTDGWIADYKWQRSPCAVVRILMNTFKAFQAAMIMWLIF